MENPSLSAFTSDSVGARVYEVSAKQFLISGMNHRGMQIWFALSHTNGGAKPMTHFQSLVLTKYSQIPLIRKPMGLVEWSRGLHIAEIEMFLKKHWRIYIETSVENAAWTDATASLACRHNSNKFCNLLFFASKPRREDTTKRVLRWSDNKQRTAIESLFKFEMSGIGGHYCMQIRGFFQIRKITMCWNWNVLLIMFTLEGFYELEKEREFTANYQINSCSTEATTTIAEEFNSIAQNLFLLPHVTELIYLPRSFQAVASGCLF